MAIENTTLKGERGWTLGGDSEAIERQEAQGQAQLAASSQLPTDGLTPELAAKHQIQIVGQSKGDPLFVEVKLPAGTVIRATDHSMWSELVADGKKIASIFYKAAYYDRRAFIHFESGE